MGVRRVTKEEVENIKFRLSDIGVKVGELALEYISELEKENAELKEELKICQSVASEIVNKMKNCGNCKYFTHKLLNCGNIQICKINPNNIYGVCDIWELAE